MRRTIRLMIIDSNDLSRHGLEALILRSQSTVQVVGSFHSLEEAEPELAKLHTHILVIDDDVSPKHDIYTVLNQLRQSHPQLSLMILSQRLNVRYIRQLFAWGASGFLYREDRLEASLMIGIETVYAGHFYASPRASGLLFTGHADVNTTELNQTDIEILHLIDRGLTPKEIAAKLEITSRTVYRSRSKLRTLLGVSTNEQIVSAARQKGLLDEQTGG